MTPQTLAAIAACTLLLTGMLNQPSYAQSPTTRPEFEVASVKQNTGAGLRREITAMSGGRFGATSFPLVFFLGMAYDVKDFQIVGGPTWISSDLWDIMAKADSDAGFEQMRPMLQSLLAERFKLTLHRETRERPVYELSITKSGAKLLAPKEGGCVARDPNKPLPALRPGERPPLFCGGIRMGKGVVSGAGISMPTLLGALATILGRPVIDKTTVTTPFDVHLEFNPDEAIRDAIVGGAVQGPAPALDDLSGPSIFTALREQLGLKLEAAKAPVEVLVIDHVERPSAN